MSSRSSVGFRVTRWTVLLLLAAFTLFPIYVMTSTSLQSRQGALFAWVPKDAGFGAFGSMWSTAPLTRYLTNSLIVSGVATAISVVCAVLAAYALTRLSFRGKRSLLYLVLSTQTFPGVVFLLPMFVLFSEVQRNAGIQLINSYQGMIIVDLSFAMPFAIWMLTSYLATIPRDIEEAAMTDGAGPFGAFARVTLPVAMPGIAAVIVFVFITAWSELLFASVLSNNKTRTVAVGLQTYLSPQGNVVHWNELMAASLVVSAPIVIGFLGFQRFFVQGMTGGAVK